MRWRQHAWSWFPSLAPAVVTATAALVLGPGWRSSGASTFLWAVALFFTVRFTVKAAMWWVGWIIVTNRQILWVSGRKRESVPLLYVISFTYRRTAPGRLLGYVPNPHETLSTLRRLMAGEEMSRII